MMVYVKAKREFTDGTLKGIVASVDWYEDRSHGTQVGAVRHVACPIGGSCPYTDEVVYVGDREDCIDRNK
jgi:hypothetical protein